MRHSLLLLLMLCSLIGLFSCMKDEAGLVTYHRMGVVKDTPVKCIYTEDDSGHVHIITSPEILNGEGLKEGDCVMIDFTTNMSKQEGENVYRADIIQCDTLNVWPVYSSLTDTSKVLSGEHLFTIQVGYTQYLEGRLFVTTKHSVHQKDETDHFELSYDPQSSVSTETDGSRVYTLFLRMTRKAGVGDSASWVDVKAFNVDQFINDKGAVERSLGNSTMKIRFRYAQAFNSDTTSCVWNSSDVFTLRIPQ